MTLLYTTVTTTVTHQIHVITDDEFIALLSAWRGTDQPPALASRIADEVRTGVVDTLHSEAVGALEDGIVAVDGLPLDDDERRRQVAERWASSVGPLVEAEVTGRTIHAVTGATS